MPRFPQCIQGCSTDLLFNQHVIRVVRRNRKIGTPSSRRGSINAASIPTSEKENGPSSFRQIQPPSHACCGGTLSSGHTTESSCIAALAGKRHTPHLPGSHRNFSFMIF